MTANRGMACRMGVSRKSTVGGWPSSGIVAHPGHDFRLDALIAGNTVVMKPARVTPLSALRLVELLLQAGLPETVIACLAGAGKVLSPAL